MSTESGERPIQRLLRNRDFRILMIGETVSEVGGTVGSFALPLVVILETGSAFSAGLVSAASMAGAILCSIIAGGLVDSYSRRFVMICSQAVRIATWSTLGVTLLVSGVNLAIFIPVGFIGGVASSLFRAAEAGVVKAVVPSEDYPRAAAAINGRGAAADLGGAPLGGILIALNTFVPFFFNALSFIVSIVSISLIRTSLGKPTARDLRSFLGRVADGYRYVWQRAAYRSLLLTHTLSNFAINAFTFSLIIVLQRQQHALWEIGLLQTGTALSVLFGASIAGPVVDRFRISTALAGSAILRLAALASVAIWHEQIAVCIILMAAGLLLTPASGAAESAYMAITTPDEFQGRVASFEQLVGSSLIPLAPLASGAMLAALDPRAVLWILVGVTSIAVVARLSSRAIMGLPHVSSLVEMR